MSYDPRHEYGRVRLVFAVLCVTTLATWIAALVVAYSALTR